MKKRMTKFLVKRLWPWFVKHVWPLVLEQVIEITTQLVTVVGGRIQGLISEILEKRRSEAAENAATASSNADAATDPREAEKYRALAQVWREVAETQRVDKEELERELDRVMRESSTSVRDAYEGTKLSAKFSGSKALLAIGNRREALRLPEGEPAKRSAAPPLPSASEVRLCPFCAEEVKAAAIKCKHCGSGIDPAA